MRGRSRCRCNGFTLFELLVASAILAIGIVGVLEAITHSLGNTRASADYTRAVGLAEAKLTEIRTTNPLREGAEEGRFQDFPGDYRWKTEVLQNQEEGAAQTRVTVLWESGRQTRQVTLEAILPGTEQSGSDSKISHQ